MNALLPHPDVVTRATHVRSTLLQASLRMVKAHGNYERWLANIDPVHATTIAESVAPVWLPIDVGLAHYMACDKFGLSHAELEKIGQSVGEHLQNTLLSVALKVVRNAGLSMEAAASCFGKLWPRLVQGAGFQLIQHGPKDMGIDLRSAVLSRSSYFRSTFVGNVHAAIKLMGTRSQYVKLQPYDEKNDRMSVLIQYV